MITSIRLERFKNFHDATLTLGPLSIIVGTNASGKSNLRDAFRFIHGMARGYSLVEILGEKYGDGGVLEWSGIRGGLNEAIEFGSTSFKLTTNAKLSANRYSEYKHEIEVSYFSKKLGPRVCWEELKGFNGKIYDVIKYDSNTLDTRFFPHFPDDVEYNVDSFLSTKPMLTQALDPELTDVTHRSRIKEFVEETLSFRFLDLSPTSMRVPSFPGQTTLGDPGENLSSVLQAICENESSKLAIMEWIRELTPIDVTDFDFVADQTGKILVNLIDKQGNKTSAYSSSDGTLRFLGMIAALLGPNPAKFYFFEEIDNGIHPTRLYLLLQLLEQFTKSRNIQVVATTHSPQLLGMLSSESREHASLVYREENSSTAQIKRIMDIPTIKDVLKTQNLMRLHESGWLEDVMAATQPEEPAQ